MWEKQIVFSHGDLRTGIDNHTYLSYVTDVLEQYPEERLYHVKCMIERLTAEQQYLENFLDEDKTIRRNK